MEKKRGVGIVIKDEKILMIHRIKDGIEYFVFPGGGVEEEESVEEATLRELKEELSINARIERLLFTYKNPGNMGYISREEYFFLVKEFDGEAVLGGPEKERMNENDQYYLEWKTVPELANIPNLYPEEAKNKIISLYQDRAFV
jgi:8-oxo-dGTP diphosphatase